MEVKLLLVAIIIALTDSRSIRSGAYHNVVVELQPGLPVDDCSSFLLSLEVRYWTFYGCKYFGENIIGRLYGAPLSRDA